jgi:hypothetical protein
MVSRKFNPCRRFIAGTDQTSADFIAAPTGQSLGKARISTAMSLVELARFPNFHEAELARGRLDHAGIMAFTFDTGMNIAEGVGMLIPVRLMVLDEDRDEAAALLAEPPPLSDD